MSNNLYQESRSIKDVVLELNEYLRNNHKGVLSSLNSPANFQNIHDFEIFLGVDLPDDFQELYMLADGQKSDSPTYFPNGYEFISLKDIRKSWINLKKIYDSLNQEELQFKYSTTLSHDIWWHPKWIPFGYSISGDFCCLDMNLEKGTGSVGQIIEFVHDDTDRPLLGNSITDFLGEFETGLRSGKYIWDSESETFVETP